MAEKGVPKNAGVDRWTNNGYGITVQPLSAEQKARVAKVNAELKAQGKGKKKSK